MRVATPSFPGAPVPMGNTLADLLAPCFQTDDLASQLVNMNVVPEPSDRCTTCMVLEGRHNVGVRSWICGSYHFVMVPWNFSAVMVTCRLSPVVIPGTVEAMCSEPMVAGMCKGVPMLFLIFL